MLCAYTKPRYQMSVYRTIGPLVLLWHTIIYQYKNYTKIQKVEYIKEKQGTGILL